MAVKREDERYSSDPMDELTGLVERVEGKQDGKQAGAQDDDQAGEQPGFRMKVTGDLRDTGKKRPR